ncbi:hypothetical protein P9C87_01015 [Aerococcus viridans]|nr:hypothetical protein [Aerococcus viridans]MEC1385972.1 hypothetical protein [Aerococcus viridans]
MDSSGEAKYTVEEALSLDVPVPIIAQSLFVRNNSQLPDSFSKKVVSALRSGLVTTRFNENKSKCLNKSGQIPRYAKT